MRNQPIIALFSLFFIASVSSIPLNFPEEEYAPASGSVSRPMNTPPLSFRTPASTVKDPIKMAGASPVSKLELIDDDDFEEDYDNEDFAPPSASNTNTKLVKVAGKAPSGTANHTIKKCYQKCVEKVQSLCSAVTIKDIDKFASSSKPICINNCEIVDDRCK